MSDEKKKQLWQDIRFYVIGLGILLIWGATLLILYVLRDNPQLAGSIGDSFGMVNSLFSAGALALLIYTTYMQRQELEMTRNQFIESITTSKKQLDLTTKKMLSDKPPSLSLKEKKFQKSTGSSPYFTLRLHNWSIEVIQTQWLQLEGLNSGTLFKSRVPEEEFNVHFKLLESQGSLEILFEDEFGVRIFVQTVNVHNEVDRYLFEITDIKPYSHDLDDQISI